MKPKQKNKSKFNGKKAPLFFTSLYLILCFVSIFSIDPVLWFLKYAALFGVLTAVLLIAYIIRTDELWNSVSQLCLHFLVLAFQRKLC